MLAQLTAEEVDLIRVGLGIFGTLFLGLTGWVGWYMRDKAKTVEAYGRELAALEERTKGMRADIDHLRQWKHQHGNALQRLEFHEERLDRLEARP
jgi:hypothetical protein